MHESERIGKFLPLMQSLYNAARDELGFKPHAKIVIIKNNENMSNPLGKTAHYSPTEKKIALYTQGRHIKDILRSLAHELVHHNQNCRGDFEQAGGTMPGYAQEDGHLREMEREAYECGNMIFRDWEDNLKDKGARPLFTSTSQYVPAPTSDVVSSKLFEGEKMKNKMTEGNLRNIIRGVLQEMFNEDLNEGDMVSDPAASMTARAREEDAEASGAAATETASGKGTGEEFQVQQSMRESRQTGEKIQAKEGRLKGSMTRMDKGRFSEEDPTHVDFEGDDGKIGGSIVEDSGEDEAWNDWKNEHADDDHIKELEHHLRALKDDRDYEEKHAEYDHDKYEDEGDDDKDDVDEEVEVVEMTEGFFPQDIRAKARVELNEALMKRWSKIIK